ncbi:glycosyltransferase [Burkholderiales bacterium]|jgi:glycosyltransferase involved in cell wall biosynthesis|nr:glycosyltransferase [Burkholderiales bacterium]
MESRLYIHATNVHQGGGKSLLLSIVNSLPSGLAILVLDSRMGLPPKIHEHSQVIKVKPSILQRAKAEMWLAKNVRPQDTVLCFGNLPPLFKSKGHCVVFIQNRYLIDDVSLSRFSLKVMLRINIERFWLAEKLRNVDEFVVQTQTMKVLLQKKIEGKIKIHILPFVESLQGYSRNLSLLASQEKKDFDFIYVASGEPHKNHQCLLDAWSLLAKEGLFPSLCLTLNERDFGKICTEIVEKNKKHNMKVINVGALSRKEVLMYYVNAGALIYPSKFESFGLPLIEARQADLPILAGELDYVRDVVDPEQTFDPGSPMSIARAVKRFMGVNEAELPLLDASDFVKKILELRRRL